MEYSLVKQLTPKPKNYVKINYQNGNTKDIIHTILQGFQEYKAQTKQASKLFSGQNIPDTARKIWAFVRNNIQYIEDSYTDQRIKSPSKTIYDKFGDCKSFSILIGSILYNLGIDFVFRFVSFNKKNPDSTHVYIYLPNQDIKIDACLPYFNQEKKFFYKYDFAPMTKISTINGAWGSWDDATDSNTSTNTTGGGFDWGQLINPLLNIGLQYLPKPNYQTINPNQINLGNYQIPANTPQVLPNGQILVNGQVITPTQQNAQNQGLDISSLLSNPLVLGGLALLLFKDKLLK